MPKAAGKIGGKGVPAKCDVGAPAATEKKKRNSNPGVRQQGGRIYDSENGTTCHQCRQKTIEIKAKCRAAKCTLYFCPRCLENRYSEIVDEVNRLRNWACPRCRRQCNCSNCRKKQGLEATGILAKVARSAGFDSVSDLLQKNPNAQALNMIQKSASGETADAAAPAVASKAPRPAAPKKRKAPEDQLVEDDALGPRPAPLPSGVPLAVHKAGGAATTSSGAPVPGSAKRQRGPAWLDRVPAAAPLPDDVDAGELACILEFVAVFGTSVLGLRAPSLAALAAELVQPPALCRSAQLCPVPEDSMVGALHAKLLQIVRNAWGVRGNVGVSAWQDMMCAYYAASLLLPSEAADLREEHGPPAVAGELFVRPPKLNDDVDSDADDVFDADVSDTASGSRNASRDNRTRAGAAASPCVDFPEGGYWGLAPGRRVIMLSVLLHDALDTFTLRDAIEGSMGDATEGEKRRRSDLADVRRSAKEAAAKQRDQEIALIIAGGRAKAMTLDEQRRVMEEARRKAEEAAAAAAAAKLAALSGSVLPRMVRVAPLGCDRNGTTVFSLQCAPVLTGHTHGLIACGEEVGLAAHTDPVAVAAAMDPRGKREGPLRHAIAAACKLSSAQLAAVAAGKGKLRSKVSADASPKKIKKASNKVDRKQAKGRRASPEVEELQPASPPPTLQKPRMRSNSPSSGLRSWGRRKL